MDSSFNQLKKFLLRIELKLYPLTQTISEKGFMEKTQHFWAFMSAIN